MINLDYGVGSHEVRTTVDSFHPPSQLETTNYNDKNYRHYRIGTWNLLGASAPNEQVQIDEELSEQNIYILGVQETMSYIAMINGI